jgi:hypothetical protein
MAKPKAISSSTKTAGRTRSSRAKKLTQREKMFYENVHLLRGNTPAEQKRNRYEDARALTRAEQWADDSGYTFEWTEDPHGLDTLGDIDPKDVSEILQVVMKDADGNVVASLGGIVIPKGWTTRQAQNEGDVHAAHLALEAMGERELNPRQGKRRSGAASRKSNSHSPTESAKKYAAAVSRADRELLEANDALLKGHGPASLHAIMQAAYWTGVARAERVYVGSDVDADTHARFKVLEDGFLTWDKTFIKEIVGSWRAANPRMRGRKR